MDKYRSCHFDPPPAVQPPRGALVWSKLQYTDGSGWFSLPDHEIMQMKPTKFDDGRLSFLDPVEGVSDVFSKVQSGKYDVKCWSKADNYVGVEGDTRVFVKLRMFNEVTTYEHPERLPAFVKTWKPIVFTASSSVATIRLTETMALLIIKDKDKKLSMSTIDYNGGFLCSHPCMDIALSYGSYAPKSIEGIDNCEILPHTDCACGNWGFFVHFFAWGCLYTPKSIEASFPAAVMGVGVGKRVDTLGVVFLPPNILISCKIDGLSKVQRKVEYGNDYALTAKKTSDTDVEIYLLMDGQLVQYDYSFDIRINKAGKPKVKHVAKFKASCDKEEQKKPNPKIHFTSTKETKIVSGSGGPTQHIEHLLSEQVVAIFDAEICQYYTHPPGIPLTKNFSKIAIPGDRPE